MSIDFDQQRWKSVKSNYRQWWAGTLGRPILPVVLLGREPGRPEPSMPLLSQATCTDFSAGAEELIDRIDYELSKQLYLGDAFPFVNMDAFGPGVIAAFLGAKIDNSRGNVWFHPLDDRPISELHFAFDPDNIWFRRLCDIYAAGMKRWQGNVLMGMTDLGGNLDILSTFRPSERLLMDLLMAPEEVKRLTWEAHAAWHQFFEAFNNVLQPLNPGYSAWCGIFSETPYYMLQCDFSYIIGPDMFREFVLPELKASCKKLNRSFYHLDGPGQLVHVDDLLSLNDLDGIQWVPGAGEEHFGHSKWRNLYKRIHDAGKKLQIQVFHGFKEVDGVIEAMNGDAGALQHCLIWGTLEEEDFFRKGLAQYGIG